MLVVIVKGIRGGIHQYTIYQYAKTKNKCMEDCKKKIAFDVKNLCEWEISQKIHVGGLSCLKIPLYLVEIS